MEDGNRMMWVVWNNPRDEAAILACADALLEQFGSEPASGLTTYEACLSHARYHAERSRAFHGQDAPPEPTTLPPEV